MRKVGEVRDNLAGIIKVGLLRIRSYGDEGRSDLCSIEADHLHNLPEIIAGSRIDLLRYYFAVEMPAFVAASIGVAEFEPYWSKLRTLINDEETQQGD